MPARGSFSFLRENTLSHCVFATIFNHCQAEMKKATRQWLNIGVETQSVARYPREKVRGLSLANPLSSIMGSNTHKTIHSFSSDRECCRSFIDNLINAVVNTDLKKSWIRFFKFKIHSHFIKTERFLV